MAPYNIIIECNYDEFWRYNLAVTGVVMRGGERHEFIKYIDDVAEVCSELNTCPATYNRPASTSITTAEGDSLTLYIYLVPHTLPISRTVEDCQPFEVHIKITHGDEVAYNRRLEINQWSGDNIEIKL